MIVDDADHLSVCIAEHPPTAEFAAIFAGRMKRPQSSHGTVDVLPLALAERAA